MLPRLQQLLPLLRLLLLLLLLLLLRITTATRTAMYYQYSRTVRQGEVGTLTTRSFAACIVLSPGSGRSGALRVKDGKAIQSNPT